MGDNSLDIINAWGAAASSLVAIITMIGIVAGKTERGKEWVKKSLGIKDLTMRLDSHLESDNLTQQKLEHYQLQIQFQNEASLANLRKDLKYMCNDALSKKSITINELEMISKAFEIYKKLGGNSFIEGLVQKTKDLEIKEDEY